MQYNSEQNTVFLFNYYWYDTTNKKIKLNLHHGLVEINTKARLRSVKDIFVFAKQCQQIYYTFTPSFKNDCSRVDWLSAVKIKPKNHVQVVQNDNYELTVGDDVFQLDKLVDPYRVASSNDLEEKSNFRIATRILWLMLTLEI